MVLTPINFYRRSGLDMDHSRIAAVDLTDYVFQKNNHVHRRILFHYILSVSDDSDSERFCDTLRIFHPLNGIAVASERQEGKHGRPHRALAAPRINKWFNIISYRIPMRHPRSGATPEGQLTSRRKRLPSN